MQFGEEIQAGVSEDAAYVGSVGELIEQIGDDSCGVALTREIGPVENIAERIVGEAEDEGMRERRTRPAKAARSSCASRCARRISALALCESASA